MKDTNKKNILIFVIDNIHKAVYKSLTFVAS